MRTVRLIVAGLFAMLVGSTAFAAACDGFTDVDSGNTTYCSAVTFLKDKGITLGCTGTTYCPNDYVTRLQMALFVERVARGGPDNVLTDATDAIGGGNHNIAGHVAAAYGTVGGGSFNASYDAYGVVGGGLANFAGAPFAVAAGGEGNTSQGHASVVSGGESNFASGFDSVIVGGASNQAFGAYSLAAGQFASADQDYCVLFSLWGTDQQMTCGGKTNVFRIGGTHGVSIEYFGQEVGGAGSEYVRIGDLSPGKTIDAWNGAYLSDGGTWTNASDRNAKTDLAAIDSQSVLARVAALPITTWRYKADTDELHLGPMAQDFHAAFGLGADDRHIATIDEGGVALAAIQGLNAKLEADQALIAQQAHELAQQAHELAEIKAQLAALVAH